MWLGVKYLTSGQQNKPKKLRHTGRGGNDGPVIGSWSLESSVIDSLEWVEPNSWRSKKSWEYYILITV